MHSADEPFPHKEKIDLTAETAKPTKDQNPVLPLSPEVQRILDSVTGAGLPKVSGLFPPKLIDPETLEFLKTGELPDHTPPEGEFIPENRFIWIHPREQRIAYRSNIDAPSRRIDIEPDEEIT